MKWDKTNGKSGYVEQPVLVKPDVVKDWFECVSCLEKATILYEGTSYCRPCIKEKLRTGGRYV